MLASDELTDSDNVTTYSVIIFIVYCIKKISKFLVLFRLV